MLKATVVVCAYNEEKCIINCLKAIQEQRTEKLEIDQVLVVSSGCTDQTDTLVEEFANKANNIPVKLIKEPKRLGKTYAINTALNNIDNVQIVIMYNADALIDNDSFENLCIPFHENENIGMVGARILPWVPEMGLWPRLGHLLWRLHDQVALISPKCGELVAFKAGVIKNIMTQSTVDEACLEFLFKKYNYDLAYSRSAIVYVGIPLNFHDWNLQRKRIYSGHFRLAKKTGYVVSTDRLPVYVKAVYRDLKHNPKDILLIGAFIFLAVYNVIPAFIGTHAGKEGGSTWAVVKSSKERVPESI